MTARTCYIFIQGIMEQYRGLWNTHIILYKKKWYTQLSHSTHKYIWNVVIIHIYTGSIWNQVAHFPQLIVSAIVTSQTLQKYSPSSLSSPESKSPSVAVVELKLESKILTRAAAVCFYITLGDLILRHHFFSPDFDFFLLLVCSFFFTTLFQKWTPRYILCITCQTSLVFFDTALALPRAKISSMPVESVCDWRWWLRGFELLNWEGLHKRRVQEDLTVVMPHCQQHS